MLEHVVECARRVLGEPVLGELAEVVAVGVELVTADVEEVLGEEGRELVVDVLDDLVGLGVHQLELSWVRLDGGVERPVVVRPPRVLAGDDVWVDLLPAS